MPSDNNLPLLLLPHPRDSLPLKWPRPMSVVCRARTSPGRLDFAASGEPGRPPRSAWCERFRNPTHPTLEAHNTTSSPRITWMNGDERLIRWTGVIWPSKTLSDIWKMHVEIFFCRSKNVMTKSRQQNRQPGKIIYLAFLEHFLSLEKSKTGVSNSFNYKPSSIAFRSRQIWQIHSVRVVGGLAGSCPDYVFFWDFEAFRSD